MPKTKRVSLTQKSLQKWKSEGWTCARVEHFNPYIGITQDLYGFIDILAMKEGEGFVGIQTTSRNHISTRINKMRSLSTPKTFLEAGGRIVVEGWDKHRKDKQGKRELWRVKQTFYQG